MIDLLMLGIVPGTNIQISFAGWLLGILLLSLVLLVISAVKHRLLLIVSLLVALHIECRQLRPTSVILGHRYA